MPLAWLFCVLVTVRRKLYHVGIIRTQKLSVPVVIVGNICVGGSGKTPLVIWIVERLKKAGFAPGIVSRGYGGKAKIWPQKVRPDGDPETVGDEPVLLARRCKCPMAVGPDRVAAAQELIQHEHCDILVSDDGLQHYRLGRDVEIAVVDGIRRNGNGRCLPAGPLREPSKRLHSVDFVVTNGIAGHGEIAMTVSGDRAVSLANPDQHCPLLDFKGRQVYAVAGIGNPCRFHELLARNGINYIEQSFPDHHRFQAQDFLNLDPLPILMTEKDAVKCSRLGLEHAWFVPVQSSLKEGFEQQLLEAVQSKCKKE